MLFWLPPSWQTCRVRSFTAALTIALLIATTGQSPAADPQPKRVLMLHSFGLRFRPWTDYSEALRAELSRRASIEFQDQSLVNARRSSDKSDAPFVEYLRSLNIDQPPDLIVAIGAPAANFVQAHRKDLFPTTPMLYTLVERRRVDFDKLTKYDTVVAITNDDPVFFENILQVLPQTTMIAIVVGASPSETWWRNEVAKSTARFADRVQFRWYNELSFEDMLKDAANLPPHSAIFWIGLNVDAAGVAHEGNTAFTRFYSVANAPIFFHDESFFGEGIVGGPMQVVARQSKQAAEVALRILNGENVADIKPTFVQLAAPMFDWRQMQRWGIAERNLPPGSAVYFREPTLWERYWWQITFTIALVLAQAGLIALLLFEHRRRQFAEVQSRQRMAELAHVNRFATAGELTASIAHEINQPLGSILTNAETAAAILQSQRPDIAALSDVVELREIVNDILQDDRRATEVIRRMRSLLKKAPFELKKLDLNEVVQETVRFLSALTVSRKFEMVNAITSDALPILGDRIQLQQVILNLVLNGVEAMKDTPHESRTISIRTARVDQFAELSVSDCGPGIPEDKLKQVFEPFYTSKAEGMGMGLSIARTIIEAHNGFISASNREHGGASFTIRLPFVG
ncbi:sensor histidine kinase [Bradyrhizobium sp. MOS002]|jgi:signal transduction histidine kinase|uniref:sensor histidine kinase n=1 Tax=Bradyrhizobium sp. MOS002 TaxID=2133947 RepID=UPI000D13E11E|nr:sensor histidine kinase [Bradyrhizobium sp. MOS002]PSO33387.1 ATPase [Bradyrhizobium sp. MOS002]